MSKYLPSKFSGDGILREHSFTRWMPPLDLNEVMAPLGLLPLYAESQEGDSRYILWRPPEGLEYEIRSGREEPAFASIDDANRVKDRPLLSLHISSGGRYSGVWVSRAHYDLATRVLCGYGISVASQRT